MKKAIVVISFGTSVLRARQSIFNVENAIINGMKDYDFYRVFSSRMVAKKIHNEEGIYIKSITEIIDELTEKGYEEVIFQSTHIMQGIEFEKVRSEILKYKDNFKIVKIGLPMINDLIDYEKTFDAISDNINHMNSDYALVFMGHGTRHFSNAIYCQMENYFRYRGFENFYIGTVEGFPDIEYVISRLNKKNIKKVKLMPFMIVAGEHTLNDMAGEDEDSWKSILLKKGFEVDVEFKGLGDMHQICEIFLNHALSAVEI